MSLIYTHNSFFEMADAILKRAAHDGEKFPGIVPYDQPAIMAHGYILAAPKSKRTLEDQWSCSWGSVKESRQDTRFNETLRALKALHASG